MMYGFEDEWYGYGFGQQNLYGVKTYPEVETKPKENKLLSKEDQQKNAITIIAKELAVEEGKGVILIEPAVDIKFKQMMALAGDKEVFGKLLIEKDNGYLTVKDVLIPYQVVWGAQYDSKDELINKFLAELSWKDPKTKEFRDVEELNSITKNLNGHFHSHNSVGSGTTKPSPSGTDTQDMIRNREDRPYWVEIIGTMAGYSGRITITQPMILMADVEVKVKWWKDMEKMFDITENKIYTDYTYKADIKKAEEEAAKKKEKKEADDKKKSTAIVEVKKGKQKRKNSSEQEPVNDIEACRYVGSILWDSKDPLQINQFIVPLGLQQKISEDFISMKKDCEDIVIDIFSNGVLDLVYRNKVNNTTELVLSRWEDVIPQNYKLWLEFCDDQLDCEDDLNYWYADDKVTTCKNRTIKLLDENSIQILNYAGSRIITFGDETKMGDVVAEG